MTARKGYGMKALVNINKDDFILEYVGEVVTDATYEKRMKKAYKADIHHYCCQLDGKLVLDAHRFGNECKTFFDFLLSVPTPEFKILRFQS